MKLAFVSLLTILCAATSFCQNNKMTFDVNLGAHHTKEKYVDTCIYIQNKFNQPLVINDILSRCACTEFYWDKAPVEFGDSVKVCLVYKLWSTGYFSKRNIIKTNVGKITMKINGTIIK